MYSGHSEEEREDEEGSEAREEGTSDGSSDIDQAELEAMLYSQLHFEANPDSSTVSLSDTLTSLGNINEYEFAIEDDKDKKSEDSAESGQKKEISGQVTDKGFKNDCSVLPLGDSQTSEKKEVVKKDITPKSTEGIDKTELAKFLSGITEEAVKSVKSDVKSKSKGNKKGEDKATSQEKDENVIVIDSGSDSGVDKDKEIAPKKLVFKGREYIVIDSDSSVKDADEGKKVKSKIKYSPSKDKGITDSEEEEAEEESDSAQSESDKTSTGSESDQEVVLGVEEEEGQKQDADLKLHVTLPTQPKVVLDCFELEDFMELTLEDVHKSMDDCDWSVTPKDRYKTKPMTRYYTPTNLNVVCRNCNERGHLSKLCPKPKKVVMCILCGMPGHMSRSCPRSICYNCERPGHAARECNQPHRNRYIECHRCLMPGHSKNYCSDHWRQFHLTTEEGPLVRGDDKENSKKYCCNCAKKGHFSFDCRLPLMDKFSTPNYTFTAKYVDTHKETTKKSKKSSKRKKQDSQDGDDDDERPRKRAKLAQMGKKLTSFAAKVKERVKNKLSGNKNYKLKTQQKFEAKHSGDFRRGKNDNTEEIEPSTSKRDESVESSAPCRSRSQSQQRRNKEDSNKEDVPSSIPFDSNPRKSRGGRKKQGKNQKHHTYQEERFEQIHSKRSKSRLEQERSISNSTKSSTGRSPSSHNRGRPNQWRSPSNSQSQGSRQGSAGSKREESEGSQKRKPRSKNRNKKKKNQKNSPAASKNNGKINFTDNSHSQRGFQFRKNRH